MPSYPNLSQVHLTGGVIAPPVTTTPDEDLPMLLSNFAPPLKFLYGKSIYTSTTVTSAMNITVDLSNAIVGAVAIVRLVSNGTIIPTFANNLKASGAPVWTNTAGTAHILQFLYDGVDVWYNILPQPGAGGGNVTPPAPTTTTLSGFAVNTLGTQFTYNTTTATQGLVGTLTVAGSPRTLTYVSSGVSDISGSPVQVGQVCTFTLTESLPASVAAITGAAVTNNSTVPSGTGALTKRAMGYSFNSGATASGDNVTLPAMGATAVSSYAIDAAQPFEITFNPTGENIVVLLEKDTSNPGGFGGARTETVLAVYWADGNISFSRNNATASVAHSGFLPVRLSKQGNDIYIEVLYQGVYYPAAGSSLATNVLTGITNMYTKVELRAGTNLTAEVILKT